MDEKKQVEETQDQPKDKSEETTTSEASTSNSFWGKLGNFVKEKVDCCLE